MLCFPQEWSQVATKFAISENSALEWESRFTLEINIAKSTDYIKKCFSQKLSKIIFPTKTLLDSYLYLPQ